MATTIKPAFKPGTKVSHAKHGTGKVTELNQAENGLWVSVEFGDKKNEGYTLPEASPQRELTFGEKAVGLTFNPGGNRDVTLIKEHFANVIDLLNALRAATENQDTKRMLSIAITEAQTAQMWASKAVTWQY